MSKVLVNESSLTSIANAIREKNGQTTKYKPAEMGTAISNIVNEMPSKLFQTANQKFYGNAWNWVIEDYPEQFNGELKGRYRLFYNNTGFEELPFKVVFDSTSDNVNIFSQTFQGSNFKRLNLEVRDRTICNLDSTFSGCNYLVEINEDMFNPESNLPLELSFSGTFSNCYSLRKTPTFSSSHMVRKFSRVYENCYVLDEIKAIPLVESDVFNGLNNFNSILSNCYRLKTLTFEANKTAKIISAYIDLRKNIGYAPSTDFAFNYLPEGITEETLVNDALTYQALKNNSDYWTTDVNYSRYNHDSAVETINSLPDTSAYLATNSGTNNILFNGLSGALTNGGAINTLTETEIAVATAQGWTVSLV